MELGVRRLLRLLTKKSFNCNTRQKPFITVWIVLDRAKMYFQRMKDTVSPCFSMTRLRQLFQSFDSFIFHAFNNRTTTKSWSRAREMTRKVELRVNKYKWLSLLKWCVAVILETTLLLEAHFLWVSFLVYAFSLRSHLSSQLTTR